MEKNGNNKNIVKKISRLIIYFLPNLLILANKIDMQGNTLIYTSLQLENIGIVCGSMQKSLVDILPHHRRESWNSSYATQEGGELEF